MKMRKSKKKFAAVNGASSGPREALLRRRRRVPTRQVRSTACIASASASDPRLWFQVRPSYASSKHHRTGLGVDELRRADGDRQMHGGLGASAGGAASAYSNCVLNDQ